jgi:hypothetical protein
MQATSYTEGVYHVDVAVLDLGSGQVRILVRDAGSPAYSPTGHLLFTRGDALLAVRSISASSRRRDLPWRSRGDSGSTRAG